MQITRRAALALAAASLAAVTGAALAQAYPAKPIRIIVPFPAGGGTDIITREVTNKVAGGYTFVVENKPGTGGNIGVDAAAKSAPDGYTLVMGQTSNLAINATLFKNLPYDPVKDLEPVMLVGSSPIAIVVRNDSPHKTLADLVAAGKAKPGAISMATPGNGTVAHLTGVRIMQATGAKFEHIPYKGAAAAIPDLLGGNVDFHIAYIGQKQGDQLSSMHGPGEVTGDIAQLCAHEIAPDKYVKMIECQDKDPSHVDTNWESCGKEVGIDTGAVKACMDSRGQKLLAASFDESKQRGATGSPTMFLKLVPRPTSMLSPCVVTCSGTLLKRLRSFQP